LSSVPYLPGIDGMRALAVVAVMVYHANHEWLPGGFLGVEVFFVISGYLITLLLVGEHERTGRISLRHFWARRARRLLPALFFMLLLVITYTWIWEREELARLRGDVLAGLGYVSNWYQVWVGQGYTAASAFVPLRHLWSLAVEEQFYLFWPIVMALLIRVRGQRRLPNLSRWLLIVAVAITVAVALLFQPGRELAADGSQVPDQFWHVGDRAVSRTDALYLSTITRSTGLLIGAAFALIWRPRAVMRGPLRNKGLILDVLAVIGLASLAALVWSIHLVTPDGADPMLFRGGFIAVGFATVFVMAAVTHGATWSGPILGNRLLNWIGTRSYGLYLYHWPIYQAIRKAAGNPLSIREFVVAMAITVVITEFSYRVIEMPIRRRQMPAWLERVRHRRAPIRRAIVAYGAVACLALFGFAGANMATAELQQSDQELAQQQGEEVVVDFGAELAGPSGAEGKPGLGSTTATAATAATTDRPTTSEPADPTDPVPSTSDSPTTTDAIVIAPAMRDTSEPAESTSEPASSTESAATTEPGESSEPAATSEPAESTEPDQTTEPAETTQPSDTSEPETEWPPFGGSPGQADHVLAAADSTVAPETTERVTTSTTEPWSAEKDFDASAPMFVLATTTTTTTTTGRRPLRHPPGGAPRWGRRRLRRRRLRHRRPTRCPRHRRILGRCWRSATR
jgi:peptidoglycan/LPS O-acetylase OafA/YrhL